MMHHYIVRVESGTGRVQSESESLDVAIRNVMIQTKADSPGVSWYVLSTCRAMSIGEITHGEMIW